MRCEIDDLFLANTFPLGYKICTHRSNLFYACVSVFISPASLVRFRYTMGGDREYL